jgi:hypothetical protein
MDRRCARSDARRRPTSPPDRIARRRAVTLRGLVPARECSPIHETDPRE